MCVRSIGRKGELWGSGTFNYLVLTERDGVVRMWGGKGMGRTEMKKVTKGMIGNEGKGRIERKCRQGKGGERKCRKGRGDEGKDVSWKGKKVKGGA